MNKDIAIAERDAKIAELTIEIDRVKKTSKQRFDKNKELKNVETRVNFLTGMNDSINRFFKDEDIHIDYYSPNFRMNTFVIGIVRGLLNKGVKNKKPLGTEGGIYAVKIDGNYKIAKIQYHINYQITFDIESDKNYLMLHLFDIEEFIFLNHI